MQSVPLMPRRDISLFAASARYRLYFEQSRGVAYLPAVERDAGSAEAQGKYSADSQLSMRIESQRPTRSPETLWVAVFRAKTTELLSE